MARDRSYEDSVANLAAANREIQRDHPLPRCEHGSALRDHGGEFLEPPCGCRACRTCDGNGWTVGWVEVHPYQEGCANCKGDGYTRPHGGRETKEGPR